MQQEKKRKSERRRKGDTGEGARCKREASIGKGDSREGLKNRHALMRERETKDPTTKGRRRDMGSRREDNKRERERDLLHEVVLIADLDGGGRAGGSAVSSREPAERRQREGRQGRRPCQHTHTQRERE